MYYIINSDKKHYKTQRPGTEWSEASGFERFPPLQEKKLRARRWGVPLKWSDVVGDEPAHVFPAEEAIETGGRLGVEPQEAEVAIAPLDFLQRNGLAREMALPAEGGASDGLTRATPQDVVAASAHIQNPRPRDVPEVTRDDHRVELAAARGEHQLALPIRTGLTSRRGGQIHDHGTGEDVPRQRRRAGGGHNHQVAPMVLAGLGAILVEHDLGRLVCRHETGDARGQPLQSIPVLGLVGPVLLADEHDALRLQSNHGPRDCRTDGTVSTEDRYPEARSEPRPPDCLAQKTYGAGVTVRSGHLILQVRMRGQEPDTVVGSDLRVGAPSDRQGGPVGLSLGQSSQGSGLTPPIGGVVATVQRPLQKHRGVVHDDVEINPHRRRAHVCWRHHGEREPAQDSRVVTPGNRPLDAELLGTPLHEDRAQVSDFVGVSVERHSPPTLFRPIARTVGHTHITHHLLLPASGGQNWNTLPSF